MKRKYLFVLLLLVSATQLIGQDTISVLFIGNSYTYYNNLPGMMENMASSAVGADVFYTESHTPGGSRIEQHANNPVVYTKLQSRDWDYVVIQCQSQEPSFPINQVKQDVFPYAKKLCDSIKSYNACTRPVFFMTWGRENGDANNCPFWPPVCTYEGMDSLLSERYIQMGNDNQALISPVGRVWNYLRKDLKSEIDLYTADGSHPSLAGSYAAALSMFSIMQRQSPTSVTFDPGLNPLHRDTIIDAVNTVLYQKLSQWNTYLNDPKADFSYGMNPGGVVFTNLSKNATSYLWKFGDGDSSTVFEPNHTYSQPGTYVVSLQAKSCGYESVAQDTLNIVISSVEEESVSEIRLYPNPTTDVVNMQYSGVDQIQKIEVIDLTGKVVLQFFRGRLKLASLENGFYFIRVLFESGKSVETPIIKQ